MTLGGGIGDISALWTTHVMPADIQKHHSIVSLKVPPCSLLDGVAFVFSGGLVCR